MQHVGKFRKIEKGKNPIVTDGGAMQRRTGETFVKWAKRINLEIHEENYKAITCPTNPEDVNQFICCGRDNKAYFADQQSRRAAACGRAELLAKRGSTLTGSKIRRNCGGSG